MTPSHKQKVRECRMPGCLKCLNRVERNHNSVGQRVMYSVRHTHCAKPVKQAGTPTTGITQEVSCLTQRHEGARTQRHSECFAPVATVTLKILCATPSAPQRRNRAAAGARA